MSRKLASLIATVAIAAASIAPAMAEPTNRKVNVAVVVSYADLDLSRAEGVETLTLRLKKAIDKVCGRPHDSASFTISRRIQSCRTDAMHNAVAAIGAPLLTALHADEPRTRVAGR